MSRRIRLAQPQQQPSAQRAPSTETTAGQADAQPHATSTAAPLSLDDITLAVVELYVRLEYVHCTRPEVFVSEDLRFVPEPRTAGGDEEFELSADELDTLFHDGQAIDLGAAIADSLALGLDPYPRSPNAEEALREAGVISEEEAGPFAALAALKCKLARGD